MSGLAITIEPRERLPRRGHRAPPARMDSAKRDAGIASPGYFARIPARLLLGAIRLYQRFLSPVLPVVTLGACACRFAPTCSEYAAAAVREHGALFGAWLAVRRLAKCTPLHPGGIDPVPSRSTPVCRAARRPTLS